MGFGRGKAVTRAGIQAGRRQRRGGQKWREEILSAERRNLNKKD